MHILSQCSSGNVHYAKTVSGPNVHFKHIFADEPSYLMCFYHPSKLKLVFFIGEARKMAREKQRQKFMSEALSHNTSAAQLY